MFSPEAAHSDGTGNRGMRRLVKCGSLLTDFSHFSAQRSVHAPELISDGDTWYSAKVGGPPDHPPGARRRGGWIHIASLASRNEDEISTRT